MLHSGTAINQDTTLRVAIGLLLAAVTMVPAAVAPASADSSPMTYVMLLNPECHDGLRDEFDHYMHLNNTAHELFFGYYEVVCLGGVTDLADIEEHVLPLLRTLYPDDIFVFVYPDSMKEQYDDYLSSRFGYKYRNAALGNADIPLGMAFASEFPDTVKHEMQHLAACGTWHGVNGEDLDYIQKHPQAEGLVWCS